MNVSRIRMSSTVISFILLTPLLLATGEPASVEETPAVAECTLDPTSPAMRSPILRWREISVEAEIVAESTAAGRSRSSRSSAGSVIPRNNFIDEEIFSTMEKAKVKPTSIASETEFLRRVTLDLNGEIPTTDAVKSFLADLNPNKRAKYVESLLTNDAFVDRWTMWFGDLVQNVQITTNTREYFVGRNQYHNWIREQIRLGTPYDKMVRELISGRGFNFQQGPPNYEVRAVQPNGPVQDTYDNMAAHTMQRFMGTPFECLSCHGGARHLELVNTHLSTRTRDDFWKTAAFFSRTQLRAFTDATYPNVRQYDVSDLATGNYRLGTTTGNKSPRTVATGQPSSVDPQFYLTGERPGATENWREAFGRMLTAHPQFARNTVNQLWKEMMHVGLVEPVDGFDLARLDAATLPAGSSLQPTHAALLERLTQEFISSGYNLRHILKLIAQSNAYQLATEYTPGTWNEQWVPYFARHYASRMPAEMVHDAITRATNVPASFNVQGLGTLNRAMKAPDPLEPNRGTPSGRFLDAFGRGDRDETPRSSEGSILQALSLLNDQFVVTRIRQATAGSTVANVLRTSTDPAAITDSLYLATLNRYPSAVERDEANAFLRGGDIARRTEDLHFTLINRIEFLYH